MEKLKLKLIVHAELEPKIYLINLYLSTYVNELITGEISRSLERKKYHSVCQVITATGFIQNKEIILQSRQFQCFFLGFFFGSTD